MSTGYNAANVAAGKPRLVGGVYMAPAGTTLPTSASATLGASFESLGYVSDDGVKYNGGISGSEVRAWGGDVIYVGSKGRTEEWKLKLMEVMSAAVNKLIYGSDNVTGDGATLAVTANNNDMPSHVFVIDMILGDVLKRVVIPNGWLKDIAEITYKDDEPAGYEVTITGGADDSGNTHYEYSAAQSSGSSI